MQITDGLCRLFHVQNFKDFSISLTLYFSNLLEPKVVSVSSVERYNFNPDSRTGRVFKPIFLWFGGWIYWDFTVVVNFALCKRVE